MRYNAIFSAFELDQAVTTGDILVELQVPAGTTIEILRAWCSAATNLVDDVQEIEIYGNDAVATGGTALTEQAIQGQDDAASGVTALGGPTVGATPTTLYPDAFHLQNGWLYLPVPEERIRVVGAATIDNVGVRFHVAPGASVTVSYGITWGEIG